MDESVREYTQWMVEMGQKKHDGFAERIMAYVNGISDGLSSALSEFSENFNVYFIKTDRLFRRVDDSNREERFEAELNRVGGLSRSERKNQGEM